MTMMLARRRDARNRPIPTTAIAPPVLTLAAGRRHTAATILAAWRDGKSDHTLRAMEYDLEGSARFLSRALAISPPLAAAYALDHLFKQSSPAAHEIALAWRNYLQTNCGLASGTVNRHLATLRSVSRLARMLGLMTWTLELPGVRQEPRRDSRGPTIEQVRALLMATADDTEAATRDAAIVTVLYCAGLRVSELVGLNLEDVNLETGQMWILGKGKRERQLHPVAAPAVAAIRRYLQHRGTLRGPLFQTRGNRGKATDGRLETRSVCRILRILGDKIGIHVRPHGLRHTSMSQASELGQRAGIALEKDPSARHASIQTLVRTPTSTIASKPRRALRISLEANSQTSGLAQHARITKVEARPTLRQHIALRAHDPVTRSSLTVVNSSFLECDRPRARLSCLPLRPFTGLICAGRDGQKRRRAGSGPPSRQFICSAEDPRQTRS